MHTISAHNLIPKLRNFLNQETNFNAGAIFSHLKSLSSNLSPSATLTLRTVRKQILHESCLLFPSLFPSPFSLLSLQGACYFEGVSLGRKKCKKCAISTSAQSIIYKINEVLQNIRRDIVGVLKLKLHQTKLSKYYKY